MTLYIFDMGGVVAADTDVFPDVCDHLGLTVERFYELAGPNLERLLDGAITSDEFWARFSSIYGSPVKEDLFAKYFNPRLDQNMVAILARLKKSTRVVCGTNVFDSHYNYLDPRGYYELFDAVYASNKMGVSKPHSIFFQHILSAERIKPEDVIFIDDDQVNVLAAEKLGIRSILFRESEKLKFEIEQQ
jgi:HAD superfamily hydrolase (TIGR01509 family)